MCDVQSFRELILVIQLKLALGPLHVLEDSLRFSFSSKVSLAV